MNTNFSARFCRKCLISSMSVDKMIKFANMIIPDYSIFIQKKFPRGYAINGQDAADRITKDMLQEGKYVDFVELLIRINDKGFMGHKYTLRGLDDVINDVIQAGYNLDHATAQFFEDQNQNITRNWGRLLEGDERLVAVLRLDIAGNTLLVKENPKHLIDKAYGDLRTIIYEAVTSRLGRLWIWEGDGALGVFMLANYSSMAIYAGIEILNEMFIYNKIKNPLKSEIKLRIAIHSGDLTYTNDNTKCNKMEIIRKATILESKAAIPNSLVISESLALSQNQELLNIFSNTKAYDSEKYRIYQVGIDKR